MGRNTSIISGEHFGEFIRSEIKSGRYASASETIRSRLQMLENEGKRIELINETLVIGEESGNAVEFDNEDFKNKMRKKLGANA